VLRLEMEWQIRGFEEREARPVVEAIERVQGSSRAARLGFVNFEGAGEW
jgi:hypothetical protein